MAFFMWGTLKKPGCETIRIPAFLTISRPTLMIYVPCRLYLIHFPKTAAASRLNNG